MILLYIIALLIALSSIFGMAVALNMIFHIDLIIAGMISCAFLGTVLFVAIVIIATVLEDDYEEDEK